MYLPATETEKLPLNELPAHLLYSLVQYDVHVSGTDFDGVFVVISNEVARFSGEGIAVPVQSDDDIHLSFKDATRDHHVLFT